MRIEHSPTDAAAVPVGSAPPIRLIQVVATKRSAHHAFLDWICEHVSEPLAYFNNVWPTPRPRLTNLWVANADLRTTEAALRRPRLELLTKFPILTIINFEGRFIENIQKWNHEVLVSDAIKQPIRISFLRDPLNNCASLAKRIKYFHYIDYVRYFQQVCALEKILMVSLEKPSSFFDQVVPLGRWQEDGEFRNRIASHLRLNGSTLPVANSQIGSRSSFGQGSFEGDERRRLYRRWSELATSGTFLAPFTDPHFVELTRAYIDHIGKGHDIISTDLDKVVGLAQASPTAGRLKRRFLDGLRRSRPLLAELERSPSLPYREFLRARLRVRLALR